MRVIVTGAQGFIGRYTVAALLADPEVSSVVGLGRSPRRDDSFTHTVTWQGRSIPAPTPGAILDALADVRYQYVRANLTDAPPLTALVRELRPDLVIHLAASLRDQPPEELIRNNIGTTVALLEAVTGSGITPPHVVLGSSGSVYGMANGRSLPLTEDQPCAPIDPYSVSKRAAEDMSRILARTHDLPVSCARIFNPLGPGQDERHLCGWLGRGIAEIRAGVAPRELVVGPLDTTRDYIDVRDTANALVAIGRRGEPGTTYNVASGIETAGTEVLELLLAHSGLTDRIDLRERPARPADMPRHVADVTRLAGLGHIDRHPLDSALNDVLGYYRDEVEPVATPHRASPPNRHRSLSLECRLTHRYDVDVRPGLLGDLPAILADRFPGTRMIVLTDDRVQDLVGASIADGLADLGVATSSVVVPEGEVSKALDSYERVIAELNEQRFDRRSVLVNVGGGMITDLGGFVAASYLRGVSYVNVPTTLLAQHDSAIGGKVAVNAPWAKNFIGAFHHPRAVYCDPDVLATLSDRDLRSGIAEAIKVALCGAPGLFDDLARARDAVFERDPNVLGDIVRDAAAHKIALLEPDPYEIDLRRALNLGHTFGHALEVELEFDQIRHGEAVGFGLAVATMIGRALDLCDVGDAERILDLLWSYGLPPAVDEARLRAAVKRVDDVRLVRAGLLNYVVPTGPASVEILAELPDDSLDRAIDDVAAHPTIGSVVRR